MKSIKNLREQYELITEKEDKEQRKLTTLVRAGLFDAKKLPMLKRALDKGADKMTPAEKKILIDLLDSLMNQVISNEPVYMKVKRNVQGMNEELVVEAPVTVSDVPSIVVLKRKAVRVYPGGQQVGLYYSQQLDKYVTIPFGEAGISEEIIDEARRRPRSRYDDDEDDDTERLLDRRANKLLFKPGRKYSSLTATQQKFLDSDNRAIKTIANKSGINKRAKAAGILTYLLLKRGKKDNVNPLSKKPAGSNMSSTIEEGNPLKALDLGADLLRYGKKFLKGAKISSAERRAKALERLKRIKSKNKNAFKGGKDGKRGKGGRAAAIAAGLAAMGGDAGSGSNNERKFSTHSHTRDPNLTRIVAPQSGQSRTSVDVQDYNRNKRFTQAGLRPIKESVNVDLDGNIFTINSDIADKFVDVYNSLNEANQKKMLNMMLNEETQNKVMEFVTRY